MDDIVLAFRAPFARFARTGFSAMVDIVLIAHGFGADEALFKIRVDRACRLRGLGTAKDGPGPCFFRTNGEEGDQVQQLITRTDDAGEARLRQA